VSAGQQTSVPQNQDVLIFFLNRKPRMSPFSENDYGNHYMMTQGANGGTNFVGTEFQFKTFWQ